MGIKIVYKRDSPPYASIYEHNRAELVLVGRNAAINVFRYVGQGTQESLSLANPIALTRGWYRAVIRFTLGKPPTKSFFFVDDKGDVAEFPNEGRLLAAAQAYLRADLNWSRGGKWLHAEGPEPEPARRRKFIPETLTRFDRIDKDIVPDLTSLPVPQMGEEDLTEELEAIVVKETRRPSRPRKPRPTPQEISAIDVALDNAVREMENQPREPPVDPMAAVLDEFLKSL